MKPGRERSSDESCLAKQMALLHIDMKKNKKSSSKKKWVPDLLEARLEELLSDVDLMGMILSLDAILLGGQTQTPSFNRDGHVPVAEEESMIVDGEKLNEDDEFINNLMASFDEWVSDPID